jgi:hypothetical protein
MGGSRTVKTLAVLFVAMTLGALALMLLEPEPVRPTPAALEVLSSPPVGAAQLISQTLAPLQSDKWRSVFVHAARDESANPARECHFVVAPDGVGGWKISPTDHWMRQEPGRHVEGVWKNNSVGVCLIGDFSRTPPKAAQFELLVQLVNALQETCRVPADHVYLLSDIDPRSPSPGAAFPAAKLSARLLRPL